MLIQVLKSCKANFTFLYAILWSNAKEENKKVLKKIQETSEIRCNTGQRWYK